MMRQNMQQIRTKLKSQLFAKKRIRQSVDLEDSEIQERRCRRKQFEEVYELCNQIGQGAHGIVYICKKIKTQKIYAVKQIRTDEPEIVNTIIKAHNIQRSLRDLPSVCTAYDLFIDEKSYNHYEVMEYCSWPTLQSLKGLQQQQIIQIIKKLGEAVAQIHKRGISHRDLKPENILVQLEPEVQIKLLDFGVSKRFKVRNNLIDMWTRTGTIFYTAPEIYMGGGYDEKVDVWAIGVIMYELLCGTLPYYSDYLTDTIEMITSDKPIYQRQEFNSLSKIQKDLINRLLKQNPHQRLNAEDIQMHLLFECGSNCSQDDLNLEKDFYQISRTQSERSDINVHFSHILQLMNKTLQYNTVSKIDYLQSKSIPNSVPIPRPIVEQNAKSSVQAVQPPIDVVPSTILPKGSQKKISLKPSLELQQQKQSIVQQPQDQREMQLYALQNQKGLEKENQELRTQLLFQTREIMNAQGLKDENQALRQRLAELKEIAEKVKNLELENTKYRQKLGEMSSELNMLKAQNGEMSKVCTEIDSLRSEVAKYKALEIQHNQLLAQSLQLKSDLDQTTRLLGKQQNVQDENKRISQAYDNIKQDNKVMISQIADLRKNNDELMQDNIKMKKLLDEINYDYVELQKSYQKLTIVNQNQQVEIQKQQEAIQLLQLDNFHLKQKNDNLQKLIFQSENKDQQIGDVKYKMGMMEANMKQLQQNYDNCQKKLDQVQREYDQQLLENRNLKMQLDSQINSNRQLQDSNYKLKDLESKYQVLQEDYQQLNQQFINKNQESKQYMGDAQRYYQQQKQLELIDGHNKKLVEQMSMLERELSLLRGTRVQQDHQLKQLEDLKYANNMQNQQIQILQTDLQRWKDYAHKMEIYTNQTKINQTLIDDPQRNTQFNK